MNSFECADCSGVVIIVTIGTPSVRSLLAFWLALICFGVLYPKSYPLRFSDYNAAPIPPKHGSRIGITPTKRSDCSGRNDCRFEYSGRNDCFN